MLEGRTVSLVVCDRSGSVIGTIPTAEVDTPWWQDVAPIHRRHPALTILRLLTVEPGPSGDRGGAVSYLAELAPDRAPPPYLVPVTTGVPDVDAVLVDHPLRAPWARPGGPATDVAWATEAVAAAGLQLDGSPELQRTWNLSAIWTLPVRRRDGASATVWLKCVPPFFQHEAGVLRLLADEHVPRLVATDGHRLLLDEMPGHDGYEATIDESRRIIDHLVGVQVRTASRLADLLSAGVPDARTAPLAAEVQSLVGRRGGDLPHLDGSLEALATTAPERCEQAAACGLPDVLVHGDAHPGNARLGTDPPMLFDWGDSRIGSPLLDLAVLERAPEPIREVLTEHWLSAWERVVSGSDPRGGWERLRPVAMLRAGAVYQGFLDRIEPSERVYHDRDVPRALARAAMLASEG